MEKQQNNLLMSWVNNKTFPSISAFLLIFLAFKIQGMQQETAVSASIWNKFTSAVCNEYIQDVEEYIAHYTFSKEELTEALSLGIAYGRHASVIILLKHGATVDESEINPIRLRYDEKMITILQKYSAASSEGFANFFVPQNAFTAIRFGDQSALARFLKVNAREDENTRSDNLQNLLNTASNMENIPAIRMLISYGADPKKNFLDNIYYLRLAVVKEHIKRRWINILEIKDWKNDDALYYAKNALIFLDPLQPEKEKKQEHITQLINNPAPLICEGLTGEHNIVNSLKKRELGFTSRTLKKLKI